MKQTTKTLLTVGVLVVVALGVAFVAAWAGKDEEQKADQKEKSAKLFDLDKANARELKLTREGKLVADIKRADEKSAWKIAAPISADADEAAVNAILEKLSSLKQKSEVDGMDLKLAGLADEANAKINVSVTDAAGKKFGLVVGEENPFDQSLYVKRPGEATIRLVAKTDKAPLEKELFDLRDKRVAHIDEASGINKLVVTPDTALSSVKPALVPTTAGTFAYEIDRDGNNWKLVAPVAGPADSGTIDRLIASIKNLRATKVVSETSDAATLKMYGLAFPKVTVDLSVSPSAGTESYERKLLIGQPAPMAGSVSIKTYAKREDQPTIYEIDSQILKDLAKELFDLQDKTVLKIDRGAVRRIEYAAPGKETVVVTRSKEALADGGTAEEKFAVTAPKAGPARKFKISGNLNTLGNLKAVAFDATVGAKPDAKELAKFGLDQPRTITLFGDKDLVLGKLLIGAATGGGNGKDAKAKARQYVLVEGAPRVVEIEKSTLDEFPQTAADALEPPPAPPAPPKPGALPLTPGASPPFVPK